MFSYSNRSPVIWNIFNSYFIQFKQIYGDFFINGLKIYLL